MKSFLSPPLSSVDNIFLSDTISTMEHSSTKSVINTPSSNCIIIQNSCPLMNQDVYGSDLFLAEKDTWEMCG